VILYKEHLRSGDGIEGDEIIQEQVGVHHKSAVTSLEGADIDDDGKKEHSNVHVGELRWGTDPTDQDDNHYSVVTVEVDFLQGYPNNELREERWKRGIEQNFALYGIHLDMQFDDTIETRNGGWDIPGALKSNWDISHLPNDENTDTSLVVYGSPPDEVPVIIPGANEIKSMPVPRSDATGVNFGAIARTQGISDSLEGHLIFLSNIDGSTGEKLAGLDDFGPTPYSSSVQLVAAATEMHELGHSFHLGETDDDGPLPLQEVYSGDRDDDTPERVKINGNERVAWGLMRSGWVPRMLFQSNSASYHVFSLEELSTIQIP